MKTLKEHVETGAKYSGSAITLSLAITEILVFARPDWAPIELYLYAIFTFGVNLLMIFLLKNGYSK
jgi:hypothetical protein